MKTLKKHMEVAPSTCPGDENIRVPLVDESIVARTPFSNTGLDSQPAYQIGIDWLDITFREVTDMQAVESLIRSAENISGDVIDFQPSKPVFNGRMWNGHGIGMKGIRVWMDAGGRDEDGTEHEIQLKIAFPGSIMSGIDYKRLVAWLVPAGSKYVLDCSRIDLCLDDRNKTIDLGKINDAAIAGNFFNASYSGLAAGGKRNENRGMSVYFGSPSSLKRLCAYDKTVESKGKILGNRLEARFRKQAAMQVLMDILQSIDESEKKFVEFCRDTILGIIDFRDRSSDDPNRFRCPVLDWYQVFIDRVRATPIRIKLPAPTQTIQKSIDWIEKSVAQSVAFVKTALTTDFDDWLNSVVLSGTDRLSIKKRELGKATKKELLAF